jgi:hypothetical protein
MVRLAIGIALEGKAHIKVEKKTGVLKVHGCIHPCRHRKDNRRSSKPANKSVLGEPEVYLLIYYGASRPIIAVARNYGSRPVPFSCFSRGSI